MNRTQAENKARLFNCLVKHSDLNYKALQIRENEWVVGQYLSGELVGVG